eukprot:6941862-Pyramimonas_sp.AAC.1
MDVDFQEQRHKALRHVEEVPGCTWHGQDARWQIRGEPDPVDGVEPHVQVVAAGVPVPSDDLMLVQGVELAQALRHGVEDT